MVGNPLTHALGKDEKNPAITSQSAKANAGATPSTDEELDKLERSNTPQDLPRAMDGSGKKWSLSVEGFYWGMFQLLRKLASDSNQMKEAEKQFEAKVRSSGIVEPGRVANDYTPGGGLARDSQYHSCPVKCGCMRHSIPPGTLR